MSLSYCAMPVGILSYLVPTTSMRVLPLSATQLLAFGLIAKAPLPRRRWCAHRQRALPVAAVVTMRWIRM